MAVFFRIVMDGVVCSLSLILKNPSLFSLSRPMTKELWTSILKASGLSEKMMHRWHIKFEKAAPDDHLAFLRFLQFLMKKSKVSGIGLLDETQRTEEIYK